MENRIIKWDGKYYCGGNPSEEESWSKKLSDAKRYESKEAAKQAMILGYVRGKIIKLISKN